MAMYIQRIKKKEMEIASSNILPENAIKWAILLRKDEPEFSYRLVRHSIV